MPEVELKEFELVVTRLDDEGKKTGFVTLKEGEEDVSETTKLVVLSSSQRAAEVKVLTTLAKIGKYDPDKPDVEVRFGPLA